MIITQEISLENFEFWSGGKDSADKLTHQDFETIEAMLEDLYPDGMSDTMVNDFFWFEFDTIAQWLGYENEEDFDRKRDPDYVDPDERKESIRERVIDAVVDEIPDVYEDDLDDWLDDNWDEDSNDDEAVTELIGYVRDLYNENEDSEDDD